ncbi:alanine racemase [Thiolapillus sp.]
MPFSPWIEIDRKALQHNLDVVRKHAPHSRVMAVIKADAYGHGVLPVAAAVAGADAFAVARIEEATRLREAGIDKKILVLSGAHDEQELLQASRLGVELVVHHAAQFALLAEAAMPRPVVVWLKLDTGMNRLGFPPQQTQQLLSRLQDLSGIARVAGVLTHLANADDLGDDFTSVQLQRFSGAVAGLDLPLSMANSAGILGWPSSHADWVRPGIMLYGASPFSSPVEELRPAMTFASRLISVKMVQAGEPVGYGGNWQAPESMPVGVVAAGYGDGYPREMPAGTPVLLNNQKIPVVGRVSMDMLMVDLRQQPQALVGDEVVLWGRGLPVETIAAAAETIPYTLFCGITSRVQRREREES